MPANTLRNGLVAVAAAIAIAVSASPAPATPVATPVAMAQSAQVETTAQVAVAQSLALGASYLSLGYSLTVVDAFTEPSPDSLGWTEVRASVVVENTSELPMPFSDAAFLFGGPFPELRVIDSQLVSWSIDRIRPHRGSAPGAAITRLEPGLAARWTVGFQVPTASAAALTLEIVELGSVVAVVDLMGDAGSITVAGPDLDSYDLGSTIPWTPSLDATPLEVGSLVCGDPAIEPATQIIAVTFAVENTSDYDQDWPGVKAPQVAAIAQWADGTAADFSLETFVGADDPLRRRSGDWVIMPPGDRYERALVFAAPRDGRFGSYTDLPTGVYLNRPELPTVVDGHDIAVSQAPIWLDLTGATASVGLEPSFCDLGFQAAPLPYAYTTQPKFDVGGAPHGVSDETHDRAASELLTEILAAAGLLYDANGRTFEGATAADIAAYGPGLQLVDHTTVEPPTEAVGVGYIDFDSDNSDFVYVITQSASGAWRCAATSAFSGVSRAGGATAEEAAPLCHPEAFAAAAQAEAEAAAAEAADAAATDDPEAVEAP